MTPARVGVAVLLSALAFGAAFAAGKASSGDGDDGGMPAAESIEAPSDSPKVPGFTAPAAVPGLKSPPASDGGGSSAGSTDDTAPAPAEPAPAPPSGGGGGGGGGGGVIIEG